MKRPKNWYELPYPLKQALVGNTCDLDYDAYESSLEEAMSQLLNNPANCVRNNELVQLYFDHMTDEDFFKFCLDVRNNLEYQLGTVNNFMDAMI